MNRLRSFLDFTTRTALSPWTAASAAVFCLWGFLELTDRVVLPGHDDVGLLDLDRRILLAQLAIRRPWLNGIAVDLTALGSPLELALFTLVSTVLLARKRDLRGAGTMLLTSLYAALLTIVAKPVLGRQRPSVIPHLVEVLGRSYPSGHSLASSALYLTAAVIFARHFDKRRERLVLFAFVAFWVLLVAFSRIYLGVHYPTDVLGGLLAGTAWAAAARALLKRADREGVIPKEG